MKKKFKSHVTWVSGHMISRYFQYLPTIPIVSIPSLISSLTNGELSTENITNF